MKLKVSVIILFFLNFNLTCFQKNISKKDLVEKSLKWSGSLSQASSTAAFATLLNKELPDITTWMRSTLDLKLDANSLNNVIKFQATFRHKAYWGAHAIKTEKSEVKIGDAMAGAHDHPISKPSLWLKSAWLDFNFDSFFNNSSVADSGFNRFKIGYFPFKLGTGISLGESFGVSHEFLGIFIRSNDFFMPGAMFYGESPTRLFNYNLYFGLPESNSASAAKVLSFSKDHLIEKEGHLPFGGAFNDDHILAFQLGLNLADKEKDEITKEEFGESAKINGYGLAFFAPDKSVVMDFDAKINLYTVGVSLDYSNDYLDLGMDCAFNLGSQRTKVADQNKVLPPERNSDGYLIHKYSHILELVDGAEPQKAFLTEGLKKELTKKIHRDGNPFAVDGKTYKSADDRLTKSYQNTFRGMMLVIDGSWKFTEASATLSGIVGYASGDENPHSQPVESTYHGFVSINQSFESSKVPSAILLSGTVRRPMTLASDSKPILKDYLDGALSDLAFAGMGITCTPDWCKEQKGKVSTNALIFAKDHQGYKLLPNSVAGELPTTVSTTKASRFLGTEINFMVELFPIENLKLGLNAACFIPGQYYTDIKGARFDDGVTKQLQSFDADSVVKNLYSTSDNNVYVLGLELKYSF